MLRIRLNDNQRRELRELGRQGIGRESERAHFVMMSDQGMSAPDIGRRMGYSASRVTEWLARYASQGVAGLKDQPRSGRPRQERHLLDVLETQASQPPTVYGYLQSVWTIGLMVLHLAIRYKVRSSDAGLRRAFKAIRYSWHRPKLAPARRPDPERACKEAHLEAVLADATATVLAADECDLCLLATVRAAWQRVNTQLRLPTPGQNAKLGVFGGLNVRTGQWHFTTSPRKRSIDFIAFLTVVLSGYATGLIYVIVDNASIHHSAVTRKWLLAHPRVQLVYLPTYSGHQLNPVEKVWWQLKRSIAANRNFKSLAELEIAIRSCLLGLSPHALLQLTQSDVTRKAQLALFHAP
jgi:transposase